MFEEGQLLYFKPFFFKNGNESKNKYFVVLKKLEDNLLLASLPTSKDHLPDRYRDTKGCIKDDDSRLNVFVFSKDKNVTDNFSFPKRTYIYGEQLDEYSVSYLVSNSSNIEKKGFILPNLYKELIECFKASSVVKRKYKKLL